MNNKKETTKQETVKLSRRKILGWSLGTAVGSVGVTAGGRALAACQDLLTPAQPEGPFYPISDQADKDNNLVYVKGRSKRAVGETLHMTGVVTNERCEPVSGALVEIWQACASGKYDHPGDPNNAELDPDFQYWGRDVTNERGEYSFMTIVPGAYPAADDWIRPSHIHMKVHRRGFRELTTQIYFKGFEFNKSDRILQSLSPEERQRVIIELSAGGDLTGSDSTQKASEMQEADKAGRFDIQLSGS